MEGKCCVQSLLVSMAAFSLIVASVAIVSSAPIYDSSWTTIASEDTTASKVDPGYGGQQFDAEYLAYKWNASTKMLSIGLQSGFDLSDGEFTHTDGKTYYAGDIALSFGGNPNEYAIDFGLLTMDIGNNLVDAGSGTGIDTAGLYKVASWNSNISFSASNPFAMNGGNMIDSLIENAVSSQTVAGSLSYFRYATIDVSSLSLTDEFIFNAHWTMSCGNDAIEGTAAVPEPATMVLFGAGLIGLAGIAHRRSKKK